MKSFLLESKILLSRRISVARVKHNENVCEYAIGFIKYLLFPLWWLWLSRPIIFFPRICRFGHPHRSRVINAKSFHVKHEMKYINKQSIYFRHFWASSRGGEKNHQRNEPVQLHFVSTYIYGAVGVIFGQFPRLLNSTTTCFSNRSWYFGLFISRIDICSYGQSVPSIISAVVPCK